MKTKRGFILKFLVLMVSLSILLAGTANAGMAMKHSRGTDHGMTMHHQHIMLNHALGMSLEGSNLIMLGQMGMAKGVDDVSVEHSKMMFKHGRKLWTQMMEGDTMKDMHAKGTTPEKDSFMGYTHKLAEAQLKVMDLLKMMPNVTE